MKPRINLGEAKTGDGGVLVLYEHDGAYSISFNGQELMHSKACASETLLGELGVSRLKSEAASVRILVGGLGLGFTLKRVLELVAPEVSIEVVELLPEVVDWNKQHLAGLNGSLLDDGRVETRVGDVGKVIRSADAATYDAILLDVDNGPVAMVAGGNASLYGNAGIRAIKTALKAKGRAVLWSAGADKMFESRLKMAGFRVSAVPAKVHERAKRAAYLLYVADK